MLRSFQVACPSCGHEFRDALASNAIKEFSRKLDEIESKSKSISKKGSIAKAFGAKNNTEELLLNHIRNFNVPNTKEDVFEFMILASSNINTSVVAACNSSDAGANGVKEFNAMKARNDAWISKVEQVYQKASLFFGTDADFVRIQNIYDKTMGALNKAKKDQNWKKLKAFLPVLVLCIFSFSVLIGAGIVHSNKEKKLEETVKEIQIDIQNGDYDAALIKAQGLHMDDGWSDESEAHWDEQRESLIQLIEEKKGEK